MEDKLKNTEAAPGKASEAEQSFDALLREKDLQAEFERRVADALEAARAKWAQEAEQKVEKARQLARMSDEERATHDYAERERKLAEREQSILARELRADAARELQARGLPQELADTLNYESAERVRSSMEAAERAFRAAVQSGVETRMRGSAPRAAQATVGDEMSDQDYYRTHRVGRQGG